MVKEAAPHVLHQLVAVYEQVLENGDDIRAEKLIELYDKYKRQELMICFAGHFSAGKSSMINALLGKDILPNSPIPTSANIVKITSGKGRVRVYFKHSTPEEYQEPFDLDMLKQYSMDKDNIQKIEISTSEPLLPAKTAFIDTPGIDAADDADRLMTEGSLHLMDALFYVMDYNHVQSEVNLQFLLDLQAKNIPFYVIINQIDKHKESELTFTSFKESIRQTFDGWEIKPERIFYSSLYEPDLEHNQFQEIQHTLHELLTVRKWELLDRQHSLNDVIEQHVVFLQEQFEEELETYYISTKQQEELSKKSTIQNKLNAYEQKKSDLKTDFYKALQQTLKNAYLMPAALRDKAASFLESQQRDFKVGLLGTKKKTSEERKKRLHEFRIDLQKTVEAGLQWKLRDKWLLVLKEYKVDNIQMRDELQQFTILIKEADLLETIKHGATLNGESIIQYTNDLAHEIKIQAKQQANALWDQVEAAIQDRIQPVYTKLMDQLKEISSIEQKLNHYHAIEKTLTRKQNLVREAIYHEVPSREKTIAKIEEILFQQKQRVTFVAQPMALKERQMAGSEDCLLTVEKQISSKETGASHPVETTVNAIEQTTSIVKDLPGFQSIMDDLKSKQYRLENRTYTMALFGAFSAGKSSFANALMGKAILPVSPNPTTAAINRIHPVTNTHRHGTVIVQLKKQEELVKEIMTMTKQFSPESNCLKELIAWIDKEQLYRHEEVENMYQAYLQAVLNGYASMQQLLGQAMYLSIDAFPSYVTDETKACFVKTIDLYYDCELTRQGISLVDTPGADSIHARHTNVAFDYIKHADAILYVTYYNHALNRADKNFLMQLGRVKDSFQLDKMFFIVNAADLAKDEEELALVSTYVTEQLAQLGIRFPRLYPVSSRKALSEKQLHKQSDQLMAAFETDFYPFIHRDLTKLAVAAAFRDIERLEQQLQQFIASQKLDQQEKETLKQSIETKHQQIQQIIDNIKAVPYFNQVKQKIQKQLYYVLERFSIRFHDMFKETFNPTTITESGKEGRKQLLDCIKNLLAYCQTELMRELQAVSLRIEAFMNDSMLDVYRFIEKQSQIVDPSFMFAEIDRKDIVTPVFPEAFPAMDYQPLNRMAQSYKNKKTFFAKNEKERTKEAIYGFLQPIVKEYMDVNEHRMYAFYEEQWTKLISDLKENIAIQLQKHMDSYHEMITSNVSLPELINKQHEVSAILADYKQKEG
ncbi:MULTISPECIES: dynamin family protein [Clostridia]|uniref:dynamin family protein n=1 Tax=Clostridia TaxID=186801 RepID=UPI001314471E|nr:MULTISPECIES: dynamin family protein [Clostridia]